MELIAWSANKFRYYVVCSKLVFYVLGLAFGYGLVENSVFSILITHLIDQWKDPNLPKGAIIVMLQEGTCSLLQLLFAYVADAYTGLFRLLVCFTPLHIIGLWLCGIAAWNKDFLELRLFYPALVIITLSQAATKITLPAFLEDQLLITTNIDKDKERAHQSCNFWCGLVSVTAAIITLFGLSKISSFKWLSIVSAIVMLATFLWFLLGIKSYMCIKPTGSPLTYVVPVIHTAVSKRNVEYPQTPEQLLENSSGLVQVLPHVSWLRWLDKAAVVLQDQERRGHVYTVEQVKGVKFLLKMLPMWMTFLTFSVVAASGSTFFLQEINNIDRESPFLLFIILQRFTCFLAAWISDIVLKYLGKRMNNGRQKLMLVRIGIGMMCCTVCCIVAFVNARNWLRLVEKYEAPELHMSVYWLIPQYLLLGIMEGFAVDGLENFFDSQVFESITKYGPSFGECVMGVGKFLSILLVIISTEWFKFDINSSHLDQYYKLLAILSSVNMIIYCLVAYWYGDERFLSDDQVDIEIGDLVQALQEDTLMLKSHFRKSIPGLKILSSDDHPTENTKMEQENWLNRETCQETASLSTNNEAEKQKPLVYDPTDQTVSALVSESGLDDSRLDAPLLRGAPSFPQWSSREIDRRSDSRSSREIRKRSHSMR